MQLSHVWLTRVSGCTGVYPIKLIKGVHMLSAGKHSAYKDSIKHIVQELYKIKYKKAAWSKNLNKEQSIKLGYPKEGDVC